jgi:cytochrome b pre-mRNA-processing protein 3
MMLFPWFKSRQARKEAAARLYDVAVASAREPVYYEQMGVADTIDGRFDLLSLHVFLMMNRLNDLGPEGRKLAQALFDRMFRMIDLTLREMGIGDMGIPKHMKKMMKAFNGRAHSYRAALDTRDGDVLLLAMARNVYRAKEAIPQGARLLSENVIDIHEALGRFALEQFTDERFRLPPKPLQRKEAAVA